MRIPLTLIVCCASVGLLGTPAAFAKANNNNKAETVAATQPKSSTATTMQKMASNQFCHANQIIGTEAKNPQGQSLGRVHDVVFNPKNGDVFAAIDIGNGRYALVPWQEVKVTPSTRTGWWWGRNREQVTINTTKQALDSAPTISGRESQKLNNRSFVQSIYSHFHTQAPFAAVGAAASPGATQHGSSKSSSNSKGVNQTSKSW
jgi:sporulation protein YlmC with PRC-barrel domain